MDNRNERYVIIYVWKVLVGLVDNPGLTFFTSERRGQLVKTPELKLCNKLREDSFLVRGPKLFNSIPLGIRVFDVIPPINCFGDAWVKMFKTKLDIFLQNIPDKPNLSSEYSSQIRTLNIKGKKSNSVIDIVREGHFKY